MNNISSIVFHPIFAPFAEDVAKLVGKDPSLFKYLSEGKKSELIAAFVLNPVEYSKAIKYIIDLLSNHDDKKHLLSIPTIYWRLLPSYTLEDMQYYIEKNPKKISNLNQKKAILEISLQAVKEEERIQAEKEEEKVQAENAKKQIQ